MTAVHPYLWQGHLHHPIWAMKGRCQMTKHSTLLDTAYAIAVSGYLTSAVVATVSALF